MVKVIIRTRQKYIIEPIVFLKYAPKLFLKAIPTCFIDIEECVLLCFSQCLLSFNICVTYVRATFRPTFWYVLKPPPFRFTLSLH